MLCGGCNARNNSLSVIVGADQPESYLYQLMGKRVALMVNQTSTKGDQHLVDFLFNEKIDIQKIFAVEHGFRGQTANGEEFNDAIDPKTGIEIISLYGQKKKPSSDDLANIDVVVFDIQDVGCRFYTYISSLFYLMEACAENQISLIVLDRPNPNGNYVDGPVLDLKLQSFVGMLPIPVVHGCTVGELALMINGEGWLSNSLKCNLNVVSVKNYTHSDLYSLPIPPSPNLPNDTAIRLYPSLCFFEATNVSIGRGTKFPFQVIGFPGCTVGDFTFTPETIVRVSLNPLYEGETCTGIDLRTLNTVPQFTLKYFIQFANEFDDKSKFWKSKRWIDLLSGTPEFYEQINSDMKESEIRASWQPKLKAYKNMRKQYLLYPDFE